MTKLPQFDCKGNQEKLDAIKKCLKPDAPNMVIFPDGSGGRDQVIVKLGRLVIDYQPGGKDSFVAKIHVFGRDGNPKMIWDSNHARYSIGKFEDFIPFDLDSFYGSRTISSRKAQNQQDYQAFKQLANEFRTGLCRLAKGEPNVGWSWYADITREMLTREQALRPVLRTFNVVQFTAPPRTQHIEKTAWNIAQEFFMNLTDYDEMKVRALLHQYVNSPDSGKGSPTEKLECLANTAVERNNQGEIKYLLRSLFPLEELQRLYQLPAN